MKRGIKIKQHDITDCGAACLASVAIYYGRRIAISRIRQYAHTDIIGTNVLGMIEASEKIGFSAKGVKGIRQSLNNIPIPAIAHLTVNKSLHHYVVIYKVYKKYIKIMDPAYGTIRKISLDSFCKEWTGVLILLTPSQTFPMKENYPTIIQRFYQLIIPHRSVLLQALFGAGIYSLLGLSTAIFVQKIVDYVLPDGNVNLLHIMGVSMICIWVMKIFVGTIKSLLAFQTGQRIDAALILGYYKHLLHLPQQFFDTMRVGEIISRINDAVKIRLFVNNVSLDLAVNSMIVVFTLIMMFFYSWQLATIVVLSFPFFTCIYIWFNHLNRKYLRKIMENGADLESQLVESLSSTATIKQFTLENYSQLKTEVRFVQLLQSTFKSARAAIYSNNFTEFLTGMLTILILWAGSMNVIHQDITSGMLMSFYALTGYLLGPVNYLIHSNQNIQDALIAADRLFQIMDLETEEKIEEQIDINPNMLGDICFENVCFRYGSRKLVFENLSFNIRQNSITAIVGESGSGKTTLIALLQKLYPIQSGVIRIGNYDLKYIQNSSLKNLISVVPQDVHLFSGSILENIAVGQQNVDMPFVIDICNLLHLSEFIDKLPLGFVTQIGEHGVSLSGGEKQRMAIARALYRKPEILILDEATSSLDLKSESYVWEAIHYLHNRGKTIVLISHRISNLVSVENIVYFENGKVVESGSQIELIQKQGYYYRLIQSNYPLYDAKG